MRTGFKAPPFRVQGPRGGRLVDELSRAGRYSSDKAARGARDNLAATMRSSGLGKLGNAVGYTSSARRRSALTRRSYGVLFNRGGPKSRAAEAIDIYATGGTITARNKKWMAFPTTAIPARAGRYKMTPERYKKAGLEQSIGKLEFVQLKPNLAILIVRDVTTSNKNGRARRDRGRKVTARTRQSYIVAFRLIRRTNRSKRFDLQSIMRFWSRVQLDYAEQYLKDQKRSTLVRAQSYRPKL